MTGSLSGIGWPAINPTQTTPWGVSPYGAQGFGAFQSLGSPLQQVLQILQAVPSQLHHLQATAHFQQQQLHQIQQLLSLIPQQLQQVVQQSPYVGLSQLQQPFGFAQQGSGFPFQAIPQLGQQNYPTPPGYVM